MNLKTATRIALRMTAIGLILVIIKLVTDFAQAWLKSEFQFLLSNLIWFFSDFGLVLGLGGMVVFLSAVALNQKE